MSLSVLARSSVRPLSSSGIRAFHASRTASSAHGHYHHLPFQFPGEKKLRFGAMLTLYLGFGFSIPFAAAAYQLKKSGASD